MFEGVYGHRADGGPNQGPKIIEVHFVHLKKVWEKIGLQLAREKRGGKLHYWLVSI